MLTRFPFTYPIFRSTSINLSPAINVCFMLVCVCPFFHWKFLFCSLFANKPANLYGNPLIIIFFYTSVFRSRPVLMQQPQNQINKCVQHGVANPPWTIKCGITNTIFDMDTTTYAKKNQQHWNGLTLLLKLWSCNINSFFFLPMFLCVCVLVFLTSGCSSIAHPLACCPFCYSLL